MNNENVESPTNIPRNIRYYDISDLQPGNNPIPRIRGCYKCKKESWMTEVIKLSLPAIDKLKTC